MNKFNEALRQALYATECPLQKIANAANIGRTTLWSMSQRGQRTNERTAKLATEATCAEIHVQIVAKQREISRLEYLARELQKTYDEEFGGVSGADV